MRRFFLKKPLPESQARTGHELTRTIGLASLLLMGIGSTLGTGIFFVLTEAAPMAGPAIILSFLIAAMAAGLTALCYAEVASAIPVSGSCYTYAYMTMGQGFAILVGACLVLEWGVAAAAVAVGWSHYLNEALRLVTGWQIPAVWSISAFQAPTPADPLPHYGNYPAMVMVILCATLLLRGSRQSATINAVLTLLKIGLLTLFAIAVIPAFHGENFEPFIPYGIGGISQAAAIVFFSFVGLDSIVTASEEAIRPHRNIPLAILGALVIVTIIYVLITICSLGAQPITAFATQSAGLSQILLSVTHSPMSSIILSTGAVLSIFSVTLVALYGLSRIYFAMARDGLLPRKLAQLDTKQGIPRQAVFAATLLVVPVAGFVPTKLLWGMVSIGTLGAFIAVAISLILLRKQHPTMPGRFRVPLYPLTPVISIACCLYLILSLDLSVQLAFLGWLCFALIIWSVCGRPNLQTPEEIGTTDTEPNQGKIAT